MMVRAEDDPSLKNMLMTMARWAGQTIHEETATRLTPVLAGLLTDWKTLTRATAPGVEPMSCGRWPEVGHEEE